MMPCSFRTLNTTLSVQDSRPHLTFRDGSRCKSENQMRASTVIEFVCDTSVFGSGMPRLVAQLPPGDDEDACAFVLEWRTHVRVSASAFRPFLMASYLDCLSDQ